MTTDAPPTSRLGAFRLALADVLEDLGVDVVDEPGGWATLPALVLAPSTPWLTLETAPPLGRLALDVGAFVRQVDVSTTLADLENLVEGVVVAVTATAWRVDYAGPPLYITVNDQAMLQNTVTVSRPYPVPS
jgi:hypothetical protein